MRIELLGGFRVAVGSNGVDESAWRLRKARALVKLLALVPGHSMHREQAIDALWPALEPGAASNNLRQALFVARRALDARGDAGAARLELALDTLTLSTDGLHIDVEEFEQAAAEADRDPSIERVRAAIQLYRGELLPEDRYEPWAIVRREPLKERHLGLLLTFARLQEQDGDTRGAIASLQQALLVEPLHELAHRELMRIYAITGRRQRALGQFHLLREALRREFEDDPDDETRLLYQDILARRIGVDDRRDLAPRRADPGRAGAGNLPLQLTSFVGRERELREVVGLVRRHRLVTLTGPGGCGKTRLSLEAAAALRSCAADGVWLVELAGLSDAALVAHAVGAALGVESRSARPAQDAVAAHIAACEMLIVLDNCEHVVNACMNLVEVLLGSCPNLRILATSREPLHAAGEVDWRVPSLALSQATKLFVERASGVSSPFAVSDEHAAAVSEICRRVDGIPLAIELAAARVGVLAPAQIAERLRDSLSVLATARRTSLTRQQTLTATLDWSHDLLDEPERQVFRRLGAFAGHFDLVAVEVVCDGHLDVLARLVDKSLVVVEEHGDTARYLLLDTVRHYAREKLDAAGERRDLGARHRAHYLRLAEELGASGEAGPRQRLELEADEMRWALRNALRSDPHAGLRLAAALWRFWHDRGDRSEGARWLEAALHAAPEPSAARAAALHGLSVLALRMSDHDRALAAATEAVTFFRAMDDRQGLSEELHHLGTMAWVFADYEGGVRWCEASRKLADEAGLDAVSASVVHSLGVIAASRSETATGRQLITQSIELLRKLSAHGESVLLPVAHGYGRAPGAAHRKFLEQTFVTARRVPPAGAVAYALCDLACATRDAGDIDDARRLFDDSVALFRRLGDPLGTAQGLCQLGNLLAFEGDHDSARELHEESLALRKASNDARGIGLSLLAVGIAAHCRADLDEARNSAQRALALFRRTDDGPGTGAAVMQLGYIASDSGRWEEARELQERALGIWRSFVPNIGWSGTILLELADIDSALGAHDRVRTRLEQALGAFRHVGDAVGIISCEEAFSALANAALTAD